MLTKKRLLTHTTLLIDQVFSLFILVVDLVLKIVTSSIKQINFMLQALFFGHKRFICFFVHTFSLISKWFYRLAIMERFQICDHWLQV